MIKSVRSLIRTMTPTSHRKKEQGTPDTAAESPEPPPPPMDIPQLYKLLDTQIRINIGTSVKCGICLSTLQNPMRTPCGHAFCQPCILASLHSTSKCPECNTPITKRSLQPAHQQLQALAKLYKQSLVEFGFAPGVYHAAFTTLTQKPFLEPDAGDDDNDNDDDDDEVDCKQNILDRLHVAATWQQHSVPTSKIQRDENAMVVEANTKACEMAGLVVGLPPTTQEIIDEAREQQVADTELESSLQEESPQGSTRRVSFQTATSTGRIRPMEESTPRSPFLAASVSPIAQEDSQPMETEEEDDDSKPTALQTGDVNEFVTKSPVDAFPTSENPVAIAVVDEQQDSVVNAEIKNKISSNIETDRTSDIFNPNIEGKYNGPTESTKEKPCDGMKHNVAGVVEDSFGALHWTNKSSVSLTLSHDDDGDHGALSLTMTYDDPAYDYHQKQIDSKKSMNDVDSKETKRRDGESHQANLADDSDSTVPMSADTDGYEQCKRGDSEEGDRKPAANANMKATNQTDRSIAVSNDSIRRRPQSESSYVTKSTFAVGDIVNVQSRTWSGINKPGGVARINKINPDGSYNVSYVLGGKESNVDSVFVSASESTDKRRRRETTLPTTLLQALAAQGFDTTGQATWNLAHQSVTMEHDSSSRRSSRRGVLQDVSNRSTNPETAAGKDNKTMKTQNTSSRKRRNSGEDTTRDSAPNQCSSRKRRSNRSQQSKGDKKRNDNRNGREMKDIDPVDADIVTTTSADEQAAHTAAFSEKRKCDSRCNRKRKSRTNSIEVSPPAEEKRVGSADGKKDAEPMPVLEPSPPVDGSNDDVCQLAESRYKAHFEAALQDKVIHVVASGLSDADMDILKALTSMPLANDIKIKLSDAFGKKTTLCITPTEVDTSTGNTTTLLRTAKVMRASLAGIPIVSPRWVHLCEEEKAAVVPRSNEVAQSMPTKVHAIATNGDSILGVARMAAQLALKSPSPLHNYFVFFCGTFAAKQRKDLQLLAREAGAKVLPTPSAVLSKLGIAKVILLCHDVSTGSVVPSSLVEHVRTTLTKNDSSVLVVNTQWIFESITCARAVPLNAFPPVNIKAKELWQLGNQD